MAKARKKEITIEPIFWHYQPRADKTFPVKLKVTADRVTKNFRIQYKGENLFLTKEQWESLGTSKVRSENRKVKDHLDAYRLKAFEVAAAITKGERPFSFFQFEKDFFAKETTGGFMTTFRKYLEKLLAEERIGTYRTYKSAYNTFASFLGKDDISPYELTTELLNAFERYLKKSRVASRVPMGIYAASDRISKASRSAGPTTVGIYTRTLRIIYNLCADQDHTLREYYPFGTNQRGKYKIMDTHKGSKKGDALTAEQLRLFIQTNPDKDSPQWEAKMYWLFSFYCQGINFRDLCYLKYADIDGKAIRYTRQKTKRTEGNEIIEVPLSDPLNRIIQTIGNADKKPSNYVFPVLQNTDIDILKIENVILQKIKTTNKWLKSLCAANDLPPVTTYWSRHTYASFLKDRGVSVEHIKELLGHSDLKTTEHYLKRFSMERNIEINSALPQLN